MKRIYGLLLLTFLFVLPVQSQFNNWTTKFGLRGNILFPENEFANLGFSGNDNFSFDWYKLSMMGEAYAGLSLSRMFELQLSAGYGVYAGKAMFEEGSDYGEYKSTLIPIGLRVQFSPFDLTSFNPYIYAGGGIMKYELKTTPDLVSPAITEPEGWVAHIPFGIGAEIALSDRVFMDVSLGSAFASTWDLDGYSSLNSKTWDSYINASLGFTYTIESCNADTDMDGLGKCDEEKLGTDPENPDSDNDGVLDGKEYFSHKTNPLKSDTDGDGLSDGKELNNSGTKPLVFDTDDDGLGDGEEVKNKTNPILADSDYDELNDGYEVKTSKTDPLKNDTDNDKLKDGDEVTRYKTNPLSEDTDADGLTDSEEVVRYKTDPFKKDTDGGTINDLVEVVRGSNPLDKEDDIVIEIGVVIVLDGITFETGKAEITPESELVLHKALYTLKNNPDISVEIGGHTDDVGSNNTNNRLSRLRAEAVRGWFITKGIPGRRITAVGYGEEHPRVANDSPENRKLNRRIEFKRIK